MKDLETGEGASKVARREEQAEEVTTLQRNMRGRPEKKRGWEKLKLDLIEWWEREKPTRAI